MTAIATPTSNISRFKVPLLLLGFAASVGLRVIAGQPQVNASASAGLLFAGLLALLTAIAWQPTGHRRLHRPPTGVLHRGVTGVLLGTAGAAILCLPPLLHRLDDTALHRPAGGFLSWAAVVTVVALAEEIFLRGVLYDAVLRSMAWGGPTFAIAVTAVAFGLLHLPLYGWSSLPLDLAVGGWLGILRQISGSVNAPATAHILADLAGWWLR